MVSQTALLSENNPENIAPTANNVAKVNTISCCHGHGILYHNQAALASSSVGRHASDKSRAFDLLAIVATLRLIILNNGVDVHGYSTAEGHIEAAESRGRNCLKKMKGMSRASIHREANIDCQNLHGLPQRLGIVVTQTSQLSKSKIRRKRKRLKDLSTGLINIENDAESRVQETVEPSGISHDNGQDLFQTGMGEYHQISREDKEANGEKFGMDSQTEQIEIEIQKSMNKDTASVMFKQEAAEFAKDVCQDPKLCPESVGFHDDENVYHAEQEECDIQKKDKNMHCRSSSVMLEKEVAEFAKDPCHSPHLCAEETQRRCYTDSVNDIQEQQQTSISDHIKGSSSDDDDALTRGSEHPIVQNGIQMTNDQSSSRMDNFNTQDANRAETQRSGSFTIEVAVAVDDQYAAKMQDEEPNQRPKRTRSHMLPSRFCDSILQPYWGRPIRTIRRKHTNKKDNV